MSIFIFCAGFTAGALLICILFIFIIGHASKGNAEMRNETKALNAELLKYWKETNRQQSLQTDALSTIAEAKRLEVTKS